jgi:hypothetical protein
LRAAQQLSADGAITLCASILTFDECAKVALIVEALKHFNIGGNLLILNNKFSPERSARRF